MNLSRVNDNLAIENPRMAFPEILKEPWCRFGPQEILEYFCSRQGIHCFSLLDPEETRREKMDAILEYRFEFNGECYQLSSPMDWLHNPSQDIEWHIMLHKFYFAPGLALAFEETGNRRYLDQWINLTSTWIDQTPPGFIASDVTGRRIQNWVYACREFVFRNKVKDFSPEFFVKFLESLHEQTAYLIDHLAPARNHRTLELYAVFLVAVVFPEFRESEKWCEFALREIARNMETDLLPDGVHCELSTDYHHIVLKNYLNVRRLAAMNGIPVPQIMDPLLIRALEFAMHVHEPHGEIPSLSDGDRGSFLDLLLRGYELFGREDMLYVGTLGKEGSPPKVRSRGFKDSGYYILRSGWGDSAEPFADARYLVFDCGPLGEGNHGHLDALNFEIAAYGKSLIMDPGRYTYCEEGEKNWRALFRGTSYHNTVLVDGKNQTSYRPGKKRYKIEGPSPDCEVKEFFTTPGFDYLHGIARSHEYRAIHERRIFFIHGTYWVIFDNLYSDSLHRYEQLFHLSPDAQDRLTIEKDREMWLITSPHLLMVTPCTPETGVDVSQGYISRVYGRKEKAPVLRFSQSAFNASFQTVLFPYSREIPEIELALAGITGDGAEKTGKPVQALSITVKNGEDEIIDHCAARSGDLERMYSFRSCRTNASFFHVREDPEGNILARHFSPGSRMEFVDLFSSRKFKGRIE